MDKTTTYQSAILEVLNAYSQIKYANVEGNNYLIADKENHRYQVVTIGWQDGKFVHDCPMHFDIIGDKIWIQRNMTEWNLGEQFAEKGIQKNEIVLGFLAPELREYSDFPVA